MTQTRGEILLEHLSITRDLLTIVRDGRKVSRTYDICICNGAFVGSLRADVIDPLSGSGVTSSCTGHDSKIALPTQNLRYGVLYTLTPRNRCYDVYYLYLLTCLLYGRR
ncbi:hypothetical protein K443DRAFT_206309 [Laccaria amethystina LaAM-08-1]|uniref:Uncharacterized protein n=1 Tax=Laccaria amethystina LaAM-08-1 TaxID=1095629 RepID=A0A0C9XRK3_9AGAR|nr:hypothetical protein K443DRAFT_206309 [Laccaria amethystina LaAM-08-1]